MFSNNKQYNYEKSVQAFVSVVWCASVCVQCVFIQYNMHVCVWYARVCGVVCK